MSRDGWLFFGFAVLMVGAILDTLTTMYAITHFGLESEVNPFVRDMVARFGLWFLPLGKLIVLSVVAWGVLHIRKFEIINYYLIGAIWVCGVWWTALGVNNIFQVCTL